MSLLSLTPTDWNCKLPEPTPEPTQWGVAVARGVPSEDLGKWLRGIGTHLPAVVKAGAAVMRWHAQNKDLLSLGGGFHRWG